MAEKANLFIIHQFNFERIFNQHLMSLIFLIPHVFTQQAAKYH